MKTDTIYEQWGVAPAINAAGTKTRVGGSRIRPEAMKAMEQASQEFVQLSELQAGASDYLTDITGAEAGYVTNGAAGGLLLAAAACIARRDPAVMVRLPDTDGIPSDILMPRTHRTGYDHALRTAGANLIDIGTNDRALGTGARDVEPWEYEHAITDETVAIAHIHKDGRLPRLETVCDIAAAAEIPVIVDAAAEVPPNDNFTRFIDAGADLVVFSGGKGIRGPQTTGILVGRADLIESAALQHLDMHETGEVWNPPASLIDRDGLRGVPRQGIGRPLKVGKEELVGLLVALEAFLAEDTVARRQEWRQRLDRIEHALESIPSLSMWQEGGAKNVSPTLVIDLTEHTIDASALAKSLRQSDPRIIVGTDEVLFEQITVNPMCLTEDEADYVGGELAARLTDFR